MKNMLALNMAEINEKLTELQKSEFAKRLHSMHHMNRPSWDGFVKNSLIFDNLNPWSSNVSKFI